MKNNSRRYRGFTLIELLVVVLILGILLAIAIPAYLSSVKGSRAATAMSNARMLATAVQTKYVKGGGTDYSTYTGTLLNTDTNLLADIGGTIPKNPCTGGSDLTVDYTVTPSATKWIIKPAAGSNCDAGDLSNVQLGN